MGIMTIVAMPSLVKSIRGNRLRVGTRTIVMAANYARTSAILRNQEMRLTINKENNQVSVDPLRTSAPTAPEDHVFESGPTPSIIAGSDPDSPAEPPTSAAPFAGITRTLDSVKIEAFSIDGKRSSANIDASTVVYQSNGRCTPFTATVADEFGSRMIVTVDAVGSVKVTQKEN